MIIKTITSGRQHHHNHHHHLHQQIMTVITKITNIRELSFYIISIYIPCSMIVVVSWFSFWIDLNSVSPSSHLKSKKFDDIFLNIVRTFLEEYVVGMDFGLVPFLKPYCLTFSAKAPARVSLAVTTLLAMSTTMASIQVEET